MATYMTTLTASDLRKREPELARLIDNNEEIEALILKASNDFSSQFQLEFSYSPINNNSGTGTFYDTLVEFLSLSYVFESLIKTDDIYIVKANRYRDLYNEWFAKLKSKYANDLYASCDTIGRLG